MDECARADYADRRCTLSGDIATTHRQTPTQCNGVITLGAERPRNLADCQDFICFGVRSQLGLAYEHDSDPPRRATPRLVVLMELEEATRSTRRDMLKKLAVTSAAAGLASTVVSSVAFADGGTVNSRPTGVSSGSITLSKVSSTKDEFVVGISAITLAFGLCPFGSPSIPVDQYAWSVENSTVPSLVITGTTFSTSLTNATVTASGNINGSYTIRLTVRWVCDQRPNGSTAAWVCRSFRAVVNQDPGGNAGTATIGVTSEDSPGPVCDSPAPAAP